MTSTTTIDLEYKWQSLSEALCTSTDRSLFFNNYYFNRMGYEEFWFLRNIFHFLLATNN